jgi:DNA-damage-inducible protein I
MRVEIKIDRRNEKSLPRDGLHQIAQELKKRLNKKYVVPRLLLDLQQQQIL